MALRRHSLDGLNSVTQSWNIVVPYFIEAALQLCQSIWCRWGCWSWGSRCSTLIAWPLGEIPYHEFAGNSLIGSDTTVLVMLDVPSRLSTHKS